MGKKEQSGNTRIFQGVIALITVILIVGIGVLGSGVFDTDDKDTEAAQAVKNDDNMVTKKYDCDITLLDNAGIRVTEDLDVDFTTKRHGIYRYIRTEGSLEYVENGKVQKIPYLSYLDVKESNVNYSRDTETGFAILQFGDEDKLIDSQRYQFTYETEPTFDDGDFGIAYINLFPSRWQNEIPKGSAFTVHFPKGYQEDALQFYAGGYGDTQDATPLLDLSYTEDTVTGTLKENLPLGSGITLYANMGKGYYSQIHTTKESTDFHIHFAIFSVIASGFLWLLFGSNRKPIQSIQYQAPPGQDCATVGYILDGVVDNKDLASLLLYWADAGYLKMEDGKKGLILTQIKPLPEDAPAHQKDLFRGLFSKKAKRNMDDLGESFGKSALNAKKKIENKFKEEKKSRIFTRKSTVARVVSFVMAALPPVVYILGAWGGAIYSGSLLVLGILILVSSFAGMAMMNRVMKNWNSTGKDKRKVRLMLSVAWIGASIGAFVLCDWLKVRKHEALNYATAGIWVLLALVVASLISSCIRRRTKQSREWMGWILGIRDFIETAELDRINAMAEEHPDWFYHLLPYAYVFGLTDTWVHRLDALGIEIPVPQWYGGKQDVTAGFVTGSMESSCQHAVDIISKSVAAATAAEVATAAAEAASHSDSYDGGGSSDGGFSGGGFGGGGGGSW